MSATRSIRVRLSVVLYVGRVMTLAIAGFIVGMNLGSSLRT